MVEDADLVIDLIAYANPGLYLQIPLEVFRLNFTENLKIAEACVWNGKRLTSSRLARCTAAPPPV